MRILEKTSKTCQYWRNFFPVYLQWLWQQHHHLQARVKVLGTRLHQNCVRARTVLQLKWFSHKKCSALIWSSIWSSQNPRSTLPLFTSLHIANGCDTLFSLKINGEVLWKWRIFKMDPAQMFHSLQNGLASIDYKLNSSSEVSNWVTEQRIQNRLFDIKRFHTIDNCLRSPLRLFFLVIK